ncbi:helix-turn-helix transcriptional regulator [Streptosporangium sp. NPDC020072]|uniref:PadR family transcriptional regulator n=1 Tax=Streptosporangium sp. NPDC020072 TaxID=3154788 RepID=UPI0034266DB4
MRSIQRITKPTLAVLRVLMEADQSVHGFDVARRAGLAAGSAYNVLNRFQEAGHATSHWEDHNPVEGRPPRRFYELTPQGRVWAAEVLAAHPIKARHQLLPRLEIRSMGGLR